VQVAINENSDPVQKLFPEGWLRSTVPPSQIFPNFRNCPKPLETKPTAADMTLTGRWYNTGPANPHISVSMYIFCQVKFKFSVISMLVPV